MKLDSTYGLAAFVAIGAGSLLAAPAPAAIEEVLVTAQKREQSLQDVGISILAFDEEQIERQGLTNIDRLAAVTPNLQSLNEAAGLPSFRIRGVGLNEFQAGFDSPVGVHVDEVYYSKPFLASMGFFDVQRVEVLKGPQGTVFGRNTTGGAVNYYSNLPTEQFEARVKLSYGRFDRFESDGHVSGPITESIRGRLAFQYNDYGSDGPYFNLATDSELGELEQARVRGILEWERGPSYARLTAHYGSKEAHLTPYDNLFQETPGGAADVNRRIRDPFGRFTVNQDYFPTTDSEAWGGNLRIEHDLGFATITSLTAYEYFERDNREDSDNTPIRSVNIDWYSKIEQVTQEIRLAGEAGRWNYLVGFYFEDDELTQADFIDTNDTLGIFLGSDFVQDTRAYALFTSHEVQIVEKLSLILGARYTVEQNEIDGVSGIAPGLALGGFPVGPAPQNRVPVAGNIGLADRTDNAFDVKVGLNYYPMEDTLLFFSRSTGFRSGGFDFGLGEPLETFDPEDTTAYELGVKQSLFDRSLTVNATAFYSEIEEYQTNVNVAGELIPRRRNIGVLESWGIEADTTWVPTDAFRLVFSVGYIDSEVAEVNDDPSGTPFAVDGTPLEGNEPVNAPELSFNVTTDYVHPLTAGMQLELLASYTWVDERFLEIQNGPEHLVDSYDTLDLSIALADQSGKWSARFWGRNVFDEEYLRYINDVPAFGLFLTINNEPATWGFDIEYNF